jgi:hypothetical protein
VSRSCARRLLRSGNPAVILGSLGYRAFDDAVARACYKALGYHVPLVVVLLGNLIGQLGGILPLPGGLGGVDGGLDRADRPPDGVPGRARRAPCR